MRWKRGDSRDGEAEEQNSDEDMVFQNDRKLFEPRTLPRAPGWRSWRYVYININIYKYIYMLCTYDLVPRHSSRQSAAAPQQEQQQPAMAEANLLPGGISWKNRVVAGKPADNLA